MSAEGPGTPTTAPVRVLYVGGMPRSGSTLLDLMLGQLPGHCDVGELFYVWRSGVERNLRCACDRPFAECPFWREVGERAFGGWGRVDVARVLALQARVDRTSRIPAVLAARLLPAFRRDLEEYTATVVALYRAVLEVSGRAVVVDSTKRPSLAYVLRRADEVDLRVVHMVRDPRGVVYSWTKKVAVPEGAGPRSTMKQRSPVQVTRRWVTVNLLTSAVRRPVPSVLVRYEDLVRAPATELARIARLSAAPGPSPVPVPSAAGRPGAAGLPDGTGAVEPEPDLGTFLTPAGLLLAPSHTVAGGRVRMRTGLMPLRLDEEWRTALPPRLRRLVTLATWPVRRAYGYR